MKLLIRDVCISLGLVKLLQRRSKQLKHLLDDSDKKVQHKNENLIKVTPFFPTTKFIREQHLVERLSIRSPSTKSPLTKHLKKSPKQDF